MIPADEVSSSGLDVSCRTHSAVTRDMKQPRGHIWLESAILSSRGKVVRERNPNSTAGDLHGQQKVLSDSKIPAHAEIAHDSF